MPSVMERIKAMFARKKDGDVEYEPLTGDSIVSGTENALSFSWFEYSIFALIGVAMLWAWNMFLAASPYFRQRFDSDEWIRENFQSAILTVFTGTNLVSMLILSNMQTSASYPFRIFTGLLINTVVFTLLTSAAKTMLHVSAPTYLTFLLMMACGAAWGTGLIQNGVFAFATGFGRPEYTQAVMAGQGVAGVLPSIAQMVSVLVAPPPNPASAEAPDHPPPPQGASTAAFIYFLTAVVVSLATLSAFRLLVRRSAGRAQQTQTAETVDAVPDLIPPARRVVSITTLLRKLHWPGAAVFVCFVVTMYFPVFTAKILSVHDPARAGRLFSPPVFIPLGFLVWNLGDLAGRLSAALPIAAPVRRRPAVLSAFGIARALFLPLYLLCNIRGHGAAVKSDVFYLLVVQFPFGLTNGWLASSAMMAGGEWAEEEEREAAGGFMGLCLVAGLAVGSLVSFTASGI